MLSRAEITTITSCAALGGTVGLLGTLGEPFPRALAITLGAAVLGALSAIATLSILEHLEAWASERRHQAERERHAEADRIHFANLVRMVDEPGDPEDGWHEMQTW